MVAPRSPDIRAVIARQLDAGYAATVNATLNAIRRDNLAASVAALQERALELETLGAKFSPNDPALRMLRADFEDALARHRQRIDDIALNVQELGVNAAQELTLQKALLGVPSPLQSPIRAAWNNPDPAALARVINYTSTPDFAASLGRFQSGISGIVQNIALQGVAAGWGPMKTSAAMQSAVQALPAHYANSMMRSLQLTSYRDASVLHQVANADILEGSIRIAALDDRTCLSCISLHGTFLAVGERVDGHRNCRCDSVPIIRGRPRDIQTGENWLNSLPEDRQRNLAGFRSTPAKYNAWRDGAVQLSDFVHHDEDPLFGPSVSEASLSGILGEQAREYYVRG